jgi:hypothetical protein
MMIGSGRDGVMRRDGGNARPSTETNPPAFLMKQAD